MKIIYDLRKEDIAAVFSLIYQHSAEFKRNLNIYMIVGVLLLMGLGVRDDLRSESFLGLLIAVPICFLYIFFVSRIPNRCAKKRAKDLEEGKSILRTHELELTHDEIIDRTDLSENKISLGGISNFVNTETYTFFFIKPESSMVIIPKSRVKQGDYDLFVETLKNSININRNNP